jgi:hypothetical protein
MTSAHYFCTAFGALPFQRIARRQNFGQFRVLDQINAGKDLDSSHGESGIIVGFIHLCALKKKLQGCEFVQYPLKNLLIVYFYFIRSFKKWNWAIFY